MSMLRLPRLVVLIVASTALVLQAAPPSDVFKSATSERVQPVVVRPGFFGFHAHSLVPRASRHAGAMTEWPSATVRSFRIWDTATRWADIQPRRGAWEFARLDAHVDLARGKGVELVYVLGSTPQWASARPAERCPYGNGCSAEPADLADWEQYVRAVVTRYRGRIAAYEVWNEPKFYDSPPAREVQGFFSGSLAQMLAMTRVARRVIKEEDPGALILSPGFDGGTVWMNQFLDGGGGRLVDVLAYHFYAADSREFAHQVVAVSKSLFQRGLGGMPIWNTESGFEADIGDPRQAGRRLPDRTQAAGLLAQTLVMAAAAGLPRFFVYSWDHDWMGMVDPRGQRMPAYEVYATTSDWLVGATLDGCAEVSRDVVECKGRKASETFSIVWTVSGSAVRWTSNAPGLTAASGQRAFGGSTSFERDGWAVDGVPTRILWKKN